MAENTVIVRYQTKKGYCSCCNQELPEPKISKMRDFVIRKDNCLEWLPQEHWKMSAEDEKEFQNIVAEFVYDTIDFFATNSYESVIIEDSEFEKVKQFVLSEVVNA